MNEKNELTERELFLLGFIFIFCSILLFIGIYTNTVFGVVVVFLTSGIIYLIFFYISCKYCDKKAIFVCRKCPEECKVESKGKSGYIPNKCLLPGVEIPDWVEIGE